jgi:hypothetical protein
VVFQSPVPLQYAAHYQFQVTFRDFGSLHRQTHVATTNNIAEVVDSVKSWLDWQPLCAPDLDVACAFIALY